MIPPDKFRTPRLVLRKPKLSDAEDLFRNYAADAEATRFLNWPPHEDVSKTQAYLADCLARWEGKENRPYIIDADKPAIGAIELRQGPHHHGLTLGYVLARSHWGQGYMTEAMTAAVRWAAGQDDISRIWAYCDVDNPASGRVMEKAGLTFEGILRRWAMHPNVDAHRPRDCRVYALVK